MNVHLSCFYMKRQVHLKLKLCKICLFFLANFRVVHVSSWVSNMAAKKCSKALQDRFLAKDLDMKALEGLMTEFVT